MIFPKRNQGQKETSKNETGHTKWPYMCQASAHDLAAASALDTNLLFFSLFVSGFHCLNVDFLFMQSSFRLGCKQNKLGKYSFP
jgi:hypothetical protein